MKLYNAMIEHTLDALKSLKGKSWDYNPRKSWPDLGASELILKSEAAYELGANGLGSANYVCVTSNADLISKDQVILYGPDLGKIKKDTPFARIVLIRGGVLDGDDDEVYRALKQIEFSKYHVYPDGYMVRMSPESYREQIRVGKKAVRKGINFEAIGNRYIDEYKKDPNVVNVTVIFITEENFDYSILTENAKKTDKLTSTLCHIMEGLPTDCTVCGLKDVCDEVEGMKELHFGVGDKGTNEKH